MQPPSREEKAANFFLDSNTFDRQQLDREFESIPKAQADAIYTQHYDDYNRYRNVPCLLRSRVIIKSGDVRYINANWVDLRATKTSRYIATQCPMTNTLPQFFRMVRQEGIIVIINIAKPEEVAKQERSLCYWPAYDGGMLHMPDGATIKRISAVLDENIRCEVVSLLHYNNALDPHPHAFRVYRYLAWPDFGVPEYPMSLLRLLREVRSMGRSEGSQPPPVAIHCSAGLGRTGTVLAIEDGIRAINKGCKATVPKIVDNIRCQRPLSVQTKRQYSYIYAALALYANSMLDNKRTQRVMQIYNELVPPAPQTQQPQQPPQAPGAVNHQQQSPSQMPTNQQSLARIPGLFPQQQQYQ